MKLIFIVDLQKIVEWDKSGLKTLKKNRLLYLHFKDGSDLIVNTKGWIRNSRFKPINGFNKAQLELKMQRSRYWIVMPSTYHDPIFYDMFMPIEIFWRVVNIRSTPQQFIYKIWGVDWNKKRIEEIYKRITTNYLLYWFGEYSPVTQNFRKAITLLPLSAFYPLILKPLKR